MKIRTKIMKIIFFQDLGRSRVTGRVWGFAAEVLMLFTFLKVYGYNFDWRIMLLAFVSIFIINYFFGRLYDKWKLMDIETEFSNERNPTIKRIEEGIKNGKN